MKDNLDFLHEHLVQQDRQEPCEYGSPEWWRQKLSNQSYMKDDVCLNGTEDVANDL